ncbi:carboxypeptidase O [Haematobia irritans]|uniref:carboxypeptidase O n=1 Tax=Haematobia irritans TaxID=7368 RepID=UPI003F5054AA
MDDVTQRGTNESNRILTLNFLSCYFITFYFYNLHEKNSKERAKRSLRTANAPRTRIFANWPFFGGLRNILRAVRPNAHGGRKSDYRSDTDENYVNYHGAQMWKLVFDDKRTKNTTSAAQAMKAFVEKFVQDDSVIILLRNLSDVNSLFFNNEDLYDNTMESLQWLVGPTDIRRYNIFSPSSTYQINRRYRSDPSVKRYYGYQLWKLHVTDMNDRALNEFWKAFGNEVWNVNQDGVDILIEYKNTAAAKEYMTKSDFTYNIMISDLESAIDETYMEVNNTDPRMPWLEIEGSTMNWNRYHDVMEVKHFMQYILESYPEHAEIVQIGVTNNKRPLEVLRFSNNDPENWAIFIDAGMQGRDWLSTAAVTLAISKLVHLWEKEPSYMHNIDWYFLPVANPDGYQYSRITDRLWTKNRHFDTQTGCFGVNLDRNFEYKWGGAGSSDNPCKNLYKGPKKFSEPETRALRNFMLNMKDFLGAYISFSGYGQDIAYPWGDADFVTDNQKQLHSTGRKAMLNFRRLNQAEYRVGSSYRLKLARAGNSADWVQHRINPHFVYNVFLKDQGRYGYLMPPNYIVESGEEVYEFMRTIALALYKLE